MINKKDELLEKALNLIDDIRATYDLSEHSVEAREMCNEIKQELGIDDIELDEEE